MAVVVLQFLGVVAAIGCKLCPVELRVRVELS